MGGLNIYDFPNSSAAKLRSLGAGVHLLLWTDKPLFLGGCNPLLLHSYDPSSFLSCTDTGGRGSSQHVGQSSGRNGV